MDGRAEPSAKRPRMEQQGVLNKAFDMGQGMLVAPHGIAGLNTLAKTAHAAARVEDMQHELQGRPSTHLTSARQAAAGGSSDAACRPHYASAMGIGGSSAAGSPPPRMAAHEAMHQSMRHLVMRRGADGSEDGGDEGDVRVRSSGEGELSPEHRGSYFSAPSWGRDATHRDVYDEREQVYIRPAAIQ